MAIGRIVHWIGVVFVVAAFALLLVSSISAPAVHHLGLLKVGLNNASTASFGPFGYCVLNVARRGDACSHASVGYLPAQEMRLLDPSTVWTTWKGHDLDLMTVAYILFPIACAIAFFAAVFAFCGVIGSLIASVLCALAFLCTLAVMVVAFVSFGYLKSHVQQHGLKAHYGPGMWTCVAAFVLLFLAMLLLFFSCCSGLRGKRSEKRRYHDKDLKHDRQDSERSLNNARNHEDHHYGRDAAVGGAGIGAYEAEKHHREHEGVRDHSHDYRNNGVDDDDKYNNRHRNHHYGRDAAVGGAAVGAYEAERHHRDREHDNTGTGLHGRRHPPANDAAARAMEGTGRQHRLKDTLRGNNNNDDDYDNVLYEQDRQNLGHDGSHHYGRDTAVGGAALGAAGLAEREHERNRGAPTNARQNLDQDGSHHYGRDAAIGGGALGAAGLGAHEYERNRASPTAAGTTVAAPRERKLRDTMRDSSNRGYEEPLAVGFNQRHVSQARDIGAPAHHLTTHQGRSPPSYLMDPAVVTHNIPGDGGNVRDTRFPEHRTMTHHHPTTTTTTSTYADESGVHNTGLQTTSHDPMTGQTRRYTPGSAI